MTIDMSQFFQVFFEETEELLAEMEKLLLAIDVSMVAATPITMSNRMRKDAHWISRASKAGARSADCVFSPTVFSRRCLSVTGIPVRRLAERSTPST